MNHRAGHVVMLITGILAVRPNPKADHFYSRGGGIGPGDKLGVSFERRDPPFSEATELRRRGQAGVRSGEAAMLAKGAPI